MEFIEINVKSTVDGSIEPSLFAKSDIEGKRPLLVFLHTWSFDRHNQKARISYAERRGFHLLLPEFRGPNLLKNPRKEEACGSKIARQDIKDAIEYVIANYEVDTDNIFLVGNSGGGHMSLLMAAYAPDTFRAVAAFVPITDLKAWSDVSAHYAPLVRACCVTDEEISERSPISHLDEIRRANVKVFAGRYDKVVPFTQTVDFYNALVGKHPDSRVFIDIFDGGHEYNETLADEWIMSQYSKTELTEVTG